jgi:prepilin-type N-terminal cleavage/methylation domain-containing protein
MLKHLQASQEWDDKNALQKGFTLVELLVVIVILGILAAVVVFAVSGISDRGNVSACATEASTVRTAVEAYRAQDGHAATDPKYIDLVPGLLAKSPSLVNLTYDTTGAAPHTYTITGVTGKGCAAGNL